MYYITPTYLAIGRNQSQLMTYKLATVCAKVDGYRKWMFPAQITEEKGNPSDWYRRMYLFHDSFIASHGA